MNFLDQLKLQALRRFEEENRTYSTGLSDHALALEAMVSNSMDGIVLVEVEGRLDPQLRMQYANPAFCTLIGYKAEDVIGKSLGMIFWPESADSTKGQLIASFLETAPGHVETLCIRRDNSQFLAAIKFFPVQGVPGCPSKWFFEIRDISNRRAELAMNDRLQQLETEKARLEGLLSEARVRELKLEFGTVHDSVTGAVSRSYFCERMEEALGRVRSGRGGVGYVLCVGFDGFEKLSSDLEYGAGDRILLEIAHKLRRELPLGCPIARFDAAQFQVLLEGVVDSMTAFEVSNTLVQALCENLEVLGRSVSLQPSIGLCTIDPAYKTAEEIMRDAEAAMMRAKEQGGLRSVWYEEATNVRTMTLSRTRAELEDALRKNQIEVHYQPQLDVQTIPPKLCAVEALARWNHPKYGLLPPERFLPTAERSGLIVPLGLHVIRTACLQIKEWQANAMFPDISLILNVSASQLTHASFFSDLVDILAETEIDARLLQLDVSEATFTQISNSVFEMLEQCRQLGIRVVLDQCGKSGTSLFQLSTYPVSAIKLDRSLVNSFERTPSKIELTRLVVSYAKSIGLAPSAQGVSNVAESKILQGFGCSILQGALYSAPVSANEITRLLDQGTRTLLHA